MGSFKLSLNPLESYGPLDPAGVISGTGAAGGEFGEGLQILADPLDLFGYQAEGTRGEAQTIQMQAAQDAIAAQQRMMDQVNAMYAPYREAATQGWGDYTSMAAGGEGGQMPMSPQYQMEMARNTQAINRGMGSRGGFRSSGRGAALGEAALQAGQSEAARQYGRQLDLQRMGTGAIQQMGQAGQAAGGNVGAAYGNLGQNINSMYQNYGAQRQQSLGQGANALYGAQSYFGG